MLPSGIFFRSVYPSERARGGTGEPETVIPNFEGMPELKIKEKTSPGKELSKPVDKNHKNN